MAEPVMILLDIDGVINVRHGTEQEGWTGHLLVADGRGGYVEVRDDLADLLERLHQLGELVWASGWNDGAPLLFGQLVPWVAALGHLTFDSAGAIVEKLYVVQEAVGDRSVVWFDDRIPQEAWEWARTRTAPTLLVEIDPTVGLGPDDVDRLERWLAEHSLATTPPQGSRSTSV